MTGALILFVLHFFLKVNARTRREDLLPTPPYTKYELIFIIFTKYKREINNKNTMSEEFVTMSHVKPGLSQLRCTLRMSYIDWSVSS